MKHEKQLHFGITCVLVRLAALCRLLPHPMNFTPVLAFALFGGATVAASLLFFIVTNLFAWLGSKMPSPYDYPQALASLIQCYVMGLPLLCNTLAGDVCWTLGLFTLYEAVQLTGVPHRMASGGQVTA